MHVNKLPPIERQLQLAANAWHRGVRMNTIIVDGWSRGFHYQQTLLECVQAGYAMCIASKLILNTWADMDEEYTRVCAAEQLTAEDTYVAEFYPVPF